MPEPDINLDDLIRRYKQLPGDLETALAGLSDEQLDLSRAPDAWSIRQITHHIVDADDVTKALVKAAMGTPGCLYCLEWYDPHNTWAITLDYAHRPMAPALALLRANHCELEGLLAHLPDAWDRHALLRRHADGMPARTSVARMLWNQVQHAYHHLEQIRRTRLQHGF